MAGISSAIVVFLFRYFGKFEMGFASALIVMNVFSPIFDSVCESVLYMIRHGEKPLEIIKEKIKRKGEKEISLVSEETEISETAEETEKEEALKR